jgi:hypothetical protein
MCDAYTTEYKGSTSEGTSLINEIEKLKSFIKERSNSFEAQSFFWSNELYFLSIDLL